jgi:twitching motility two-component system response regulator PilG
MDQSSGLPLVVVVDDSKTILRTAKSFLEPQCHVEIAEDGFSALALLRHHHPQLILLDVMMPKMDGYQLCLLIKENQAFAGVPVVMLSSKDSPFDRAKGDLVGCDGYLAKPFVRDALMKEVQHRLTLSSAGQAG